MLDEKDFGHIQTKMQEEDAVRERIIKQSRDVLKASKQAIYSVHRDDGKAEEHLADAEKIAKKLLEDIKKHPRLRHGSFSASMEEYVEAKAFLVFLKEGRLITLKELDLIEPEEYLLGLCDFTGELARHAVHAATERNREKVKKVRDMIDAIFGQLIQFDFRNSELRRKYDSVKYNLKKVENVLYELTLKT